MDKDKEKLEREKALAHENGKEPFDFLKFISIYVHDTGTFERLKPDEPESVKEQYEWFYYHSYPQFMTNMPPHARDLQTWVRWPI